MSVSVLPNGKSQFVDINGAPLVGGFVYHYVLDSDTPKDTYQDIEGTIPNSNPIVLDERGQAAIWGNGNYRQRVLDSLGNEVWDVATSANCQCATDDGGGGTDSYYEVSLFFIGEPAADQNILVWNFSQAVDFLDDFAGAVPRITGTLPGSEIEFTITKVAADDTETDIGTMTIGADGTITFATTETPSFEAGGAMIVTAPADSDGASDISVTLIGNPVA